MPKAHRPSRPINLERCCRVSDRRALAINRVFENDVTYPTDAYLKPTLSAAAGHLKTHTLGIRIQFFGPKQRFTHVRRRIDSLFVGQTKTKNDTFHV